MHLAAELSQVAEAYGYSTDLWHYSTIDIEAILSGQSPVGGLPKTDILLSTDN